MTAAGFITGTALAARAVLATAAELIWPSCCVGCDAPLEPGGYLCTECAALPVRVEPPFCSVCSRAFADDSTPARPDGDGPCADCREQRFAFGCAVSFCRHDGLARDLLLRFKYGGEHYLRQPLGGWLVDTLRSDERLRRQPGGRARARAAAPGGASANAGSTRRRRSAAG